MNTNDWLDVYNAWKVLDDLLRAESYAEMMEAMQEITPEIRDRLKGVVSKMQVIVDPPARKLRFPRKDTAFTNLMNIACYRCMKDEEERALRGDKRRLTPPYGVEDKTGLRLKIEEHRWAYTHMVRGYGTEDKQWATPTIRFFYEFGPSDEELDEAAAYYTANPE